jgi:hypothetical protein
MVINCALNRDLLRGDTCNYSLPEITQIFVANFDDVTSAPVSYDCESGVSITALTLASGAKFYKIDPAKNSTTFTDELVVEDAGNKYRTHTITFNIAGKYDKDMVCTLDALALGKFFVVVHTADDEYLALGRAVGMEANAQSLGGGGDTNGITVTLSANVTESSVPLAQAAIDVVKGN